MDRNRRNKRYSNWNNQKNQDSQNRKNQNFNNNNNKEKSYQFNHTIYQNDAAERERRPPAESLHGKAALGSPGSTGQSPASEAR